jgi:hypothetical protein
MIQSFGQKSFLVKKKFFGQTSTGLVKPQQV